MYETAVWVVPMSIPMTSFSSPDQGSCANGGIAASVWGRQEGGMGGSYAHSHGFKAHQSVQDRLKQ
jgi:hypothetical protein